MHDYRNLKTYDSGPSDERTFYISTRIRKTNLAETIVYSLFTCILIYKKGKGPQHCSGFLNVDGSEHWWIPIMQIYPCHHC